MFEPDPCKDTRRWVHFTSSGNLSSINSDKRVLLGGNTSDRYDGVLCDMQGERVLWQAPRGLWFNANLYQGGLLTRTVYPERCSDQQVPGLVADVANLLPVHLDWLLFPISDVQDSYQHLKYACVTEGSGAHMWMRARDVEPVPNNEDCHVRLERTILGWQWKAVDVDASHIIVGVFFVPPHMDHIPRHVFDSREHWASKVESRQGNAGSPGVPPEAVYPQPRENPFQLSSVADAPRSFADASAQTTTAPTVQTDAHTQTASEHRLGLLTIHGARCSSGAYEHFLAQQWFHGPNGLPPKAVLYSGSSPSDETPGFKEAAEAEAYFVVLTASPICWAPLSTANANIDAALLAGLVDHYKKIGYEAVGAEYRSQPDRESFTIVKTLSEVNTPALAAQWRREHPQEVNDSGRPRVSDYGQPGGRKAAHQSWVENNGGASKILEELLQQLKVTCCPKDGMILQNQIDEPLESGEGSEQDGSDDSKQFPGSSSDGEYGVNDSDPSYY